MNEIEARETVAAWLSRDYHEELDPRIDIAPIVEAVTLVDAWLSSEQERIDRLDDAATTVEQARVDTLPRHRRLIVAAKPIEPFTLNGVEYTSMVTHRTPIECWRPEVGGEVCMGEWGHEVVHGVVVQVTPRQGSHDHRYFDCVCALSAIYEVTDEWHPHKWSSLTSTPCTPEDQA